MPRDNPNWEFSSIIDAEWDNDSEVDVEVQDEDEDFFMPASGRVIPLTSLFR